MKEVYLECTIGNHNKFYKMIENVNSLKLLPEFKATWGAIGSVGRTKSYSMSDWDKILNSKLAKGYVQVPLVTEDFEKDEQYWKIKEKLEKLNDRFAHYTITNGFDNPNDEREWNVNKDYAVEIYDKFFKTGKIEKAHMKFANKMWKKYNV